MKFKVGDLVKVVSNKSSAGWDSSITIGKTYKVIELDSNYTGVRIFVPESNVKWWLEDSCLMVIEQQLLFDFM